MPQTQHQKDVDACINFLNSDLGGPEFDDFEQLAKFCYEKFHLTPTELDAINEF